MISLRTRSEELEIMDDLDCHGEVVDQTLRELEVINRLLGGDNVTIDGIEEVVEFRCRGGYAEERRDAGNTIAIADYGCGGGDLAIKIIQWAKRKNYNLEVVGIDANPHIISFAKENCKDFRRSLLRPWTCFQMKPRTTS